MPKIEKLDSRAYLFYHRTRLLCRTCNQIQPVPGTEWNTVTDLFRLAFCKGIVEQDGDHSVTVRYRLVKKVTITVIGAAELCQSVPSPIDLAHRRLV